MYSDLPSPADGPQSAPHSNSATLHDVLGERSFHRPILPFAEVWERYADAGLQPIPVLDTPPKGYHRWSAAQAEQWAEDGERWAYAQTALTVEDGFVVLDDDYAEKVAALEAELGPRPRTIYSTSRGSGAARRKSMFRVPIGSLFVGEYDGGEVIDSRHRFMFVCPTVNRKTGEVEQWYGPDDQPLERFPTADDVLSMVAELPAEWVERLSRGAREKAAERPYDGPTRFQGGELSPRVLAVAERHPETAHYPEANGALMALARVAVRYPNAEGIETLKVQIVSSYVDRTTTRTSPPERQARMDRAWESALARQAEDYADEWAEAEAEFGPVRVRWYRDHVPTASAPAPTSELARLEALSPDDAEAEFGWDWQSQLSNAIMRAEGIEERELRAQEAPPSSWTPRDLSDVMAADYKPPRPTVFRRSDGMGLFYPGTVNEFHAVGGTGKTQVCLTVTAETLAAGQTVLYVDYEENPGRIVQRLRGYGIADVVIRSLFIYVKPSSKPTADELRALVGRAPAVVVIDTFAESFRNIGGGDSNNTDHVTEWFALPRFFADAGACVIVTDHVPKDAANKLMPIGSQAKHSSYKGAIYYLEAPTGGGLVKGGLGRLRFILAKDNGGEMGLRTGECAATFLLDATGAVSTWQLQAPDSAAALADAAAAHYAERERIAQALSDAGRSLPSRAQLWTAMGLGKNATPPVLTALADMIADGTVIEEPGTGNAKSLTLGSNLAPTPEADAERALWANTPTLPDVVPLSQVQVPGDREDITSDVPVSLGTSPGISNAPRSILSGVTDAELDELLD